MGDSDTHVDRRGFLKTAGAGGAGLATSGLAGCVSRFTGGGATGPLRIGVFGGIFEEMYTKVFVDPWKEKTGNQIEVVPIGNVPQVLKLKKQVEAGEPPVDVLTQSTESLPKGVDAGIYMPFSEDKIPRLSAVNDRYVTKGDGGILGVGVNAWYMAMLIRTDKVDEPYPTSWKSWWNSRFEDRMEPSSVLEDAYFPWLTAALYLGGESKLGSQSGIDEAFAKMEEIKPQITKFYENEAQGEDDIRQGRTDVLQMWADIGAVMVGRHDNMKRIIPKEGGIGDHGEWTVLRNASRADLAFDFINFTLQPAQQREITKNLFMPPAVTDVTLPDDIRQKAYGGVDPNQHFEFSYTYLFENEEYMRDKWNKFIASV